MGFLVSSDKRIHGVSQVERIPKSRGSNSIADGRMVFILVEDRYISLVVDVDISIYK